MSRSRAPWVEVLDGPVMPGALETRSFVRAVGDGELLAIVSIEPSGWHGSISFRDRRGAHARYPRWDEIAQFRSELLPGDLRFAMHLPPETEYVALHDSTFHLHELPDRHLVAAVERFAEVCVSWTESPHDDVRYRRVVRWARRIAELVGVEL